MIAVKRTRGRFLANAQEGSRSKGLFHQVGECRQSHIKAVQQQPFGMKRYQEVLSVMFSFPVMGRSAVHRENQIFIIAPVSPSGKNVYRKLLRPLLPFVLYFFPFKQQNFVSLLVLGFFCGLFCDRVLFCRKKSPQERKEYTTCAISPRGQQSFISIIS